MSNRRPNTRQEFINYCLRKLGAPVIKIDVDPSQVEDRINDALNLYYEWHTDGTEKRYVIVPITADVVTNGYISTPDSVWGVIDARLGTSANAMTGDVLSNVSYQILLSDYLGTAVGAFSQNFDISNYYFTQYQISNMNFVLTPTHQFSFNKRTNRVFMPGVNFSQYSGDGTVVILQCYVTWLDSNQENDDAPSEIWRDTWLQQYTTALIKHAWGTNLKKFDSVPLPGGVMVNGQRIYDEAVEEIKELRDDLENKWSEPCDFFMG